MGSRTALAVLLLLAAAAVLALVAVAWFYHSLLPQDSGLPEGGCSFLLVSGLLVAGFAAGAWWLLKRDG